VVSPANLERFVLGEFSSPELEGRVVALREELSIGSEDPVLRAMVALRLGLTAERASKALDWRSFERLCAAVLEARGFQVRANLVLVKPRKQVDLVAFDDTLALSLDCKHWASISFGELERMAAAQIERSRRLRAALDLGDRPVVSALVTLADASVRFCAGAAVVPVRTLGDFAGSALAYLDSLELS
jgi:Restriction endonuclease